MKISAQEEYGIRCLLRLAEQGAGGSLTIPELARAEGLSPEYVAKLLRPLRQGGFVKSVRGQAGGYRLARRAGKIRLRDVLRALGRPFFDSRFCADHAGNVERCTHAARCSLRPLWQGMQKAVDEVLGRVSLAELAGNPGPALRQAGGQVTCSTRGGL